MHTALLTLHIAAGTIGLVAALAALTARKRRGLHTVSGRVFGATVVVVAVTTYALLPFAPDMWWLGIVAAATLAAVAAGVHLARRKPVPNWYRIHLVLMMSAVIAYVTPVAVQFADGNVLAWILPTVVGSPLITYRSLVAAGVLPAWHEALMPWRKTRKRTAEERRQAARA
ncbi:hypothetical protein [Nocardiopsis suaedae]|uniref:DUF2306 domain-containing protein n=1 Tax=Nocardiopsis suaedae TaxID=3018444 RepID=A0ABT4TSA0_9ACTN|nr:hypothetical protein [Nocardiopsis suaedae]MDA2807554.1 hypothetical protein [Nocardiopsis suaedae]